MGAARAAVIVRPVKIQEVAARCQEWLEESYAGEDDVGIGHVLVVVEVKDRRDDPSARTGRGTSAWFTTYCDDSRGWVQRAILREALDSVEEVPVELAEEAD